MKKTALCAGKVWEDMSFEVTAVGLGGGRRIE